MKQKILKISFLCALLGLTSQVDAQVTIGSNDAPSKGALLDLTNLPGGIANKGMALPRVELTDKDKLFPMFDGITGTDYTQGIATFDKATQDSNHVGLTVYNTDKCTLKGKGIYVWNGSEWQLLHEENTFTPTLSKTHFDLPSGHDARGPITPQNLTVTWAGGTSPSWTGGGAITFVSPTGTTGPVGASPFVMPIEPTPITISTPSNPWVSRSGTLTFTNLATDCGQTNVVTLNQTNYALEVKGQFSNSQIVYTTAGSNDFTVRGNAAWKTSKSGDNILSTTTPAIGNQGGEDRTNGTIHTLSPNFTYTTLSGTRYQTANITFSDTASVKRFKDITVSILNCTTTGNDLKLRDWAARAGFDATQLSAIDLLPNGGTLGGDANPTTLPNGVRAHKDQNGNIFLSGHFGYEDVAKTKERRWMLNNLAATSFVPYNATPALGRTGDDKNVSVNLPGTASASVSDYKNPLWTYPNVSGNGTSATRYTANPRIGRLYNWAAATNSKGSTDNAGIQINTTGKANINDGEVAPATDRQTSRRQGICPNGWHLPSDYEWTELEQEMNTNTSQYAAIPDANGTITVGEANAWRGTTHGQGMKDPCPTPGQSTFPDSGGASNIIGTAVTPGFNVMLAGQANSGSVNNYGDFGYLWSASGFSDTDAWYRILNTGVTSGQPPRSFMFSVRCKKDN